MAARKPRKVVYCSGPMSSSGDRLQNMKDGMDLFEKLFKSGYAAIVPHLNDIMELRHEHNFQEWIDYDLALVAKADAVFRMPGYSRGADIEEEFAKKHRIPVVRSLSQLRRVLA